MRLHLRRDRGSPGYGIEDPYHDHIGEQRGPSKAQEWEGDTLCGEQTCYDAEVHQDLYPDKQGDP